MNDNVLGHLREARAQLLDEKENGLGSREISETITLIDTAELFREKSLRMRKAPGTFVSK